MTCVHWTCSVAQDKYLHTNCLAALANMSAQFTNLHPFVAQKIIRYSTCVYGGGLLLCVCVRERESVYVREIESVCERECVCVCERECVCV